MAHVTKRGPVVADSGTLTEPRDGTKPGEPWVPMSSEGLIELE